VFLPHGRRGEGTVTGFYPLAPRDKWRGRTILYARLAFRVLRLDDGLVMRGRDDRTL
jgi:hypothetical protein